MSIEDKKLIATFFKSSSGKEPVREGLKDLVSSDRKIVGVDIKTVEFGWPIGMPVCRPLGNGLYEVRSNLGDKSISRIIFCIEKNTMILLHGYKKHPKKNLNWLSIEKRRFTNDGYK